MRMKAWAVLGTVAIVVALVLSSGVLVDAALSGSGHDFSSKSWAGNYKCKPCHTPHGGGISAPLWNHAASGATFTVYASGSIDANGGTVPAPAGISLMCLGCHDGTTGLDSFGGFTTGTTQITGIANFGTDLRNDHPISITYNAALNTADSGINNPTTTDSGLGAQIDDDMLFGTGNDKLECASCHDVHNGAGIAKMLVKSNAGSALCTTCHNK